MTVNDGRRIEDCYLCDARVRVEKDREYTFCDNCKKTYCSVCGNVDIRICPTCHPLVTARIFDRRQGNTQFNEVFYIEGARFRPVELNRDKIRITIDVPFSVFKENEENIEKLMDLMVDQRTFNGKLEVVTVEKE